jgi:hypothetical protein
MSSAETSYITWVETGTLTEAMPGATDAPLSVFVRRIHAVATEAGQVWALTVCGDEIFGDVEAKAFVDIASEIRCRRCANILGLPHGDR